MECVLTNNLFSKGLYLRGFFKDLTLNRPESSSNDVSISNYGAIISGYSRWPSAYKDNLMSI